MFAFCKTQPVPSPAQEKTRGNLTSEEATVLRNALSNLQMVYVDVAQKAPEGAQPAASEKESAPEPHAAPERSTSTPAEAPPITSTESESKKKFTKSYGP